MVIAAPEAVLARVSAATELPIVKAVDGMMELLAMVREDVLPIVRIPELPTEKFLAPALF
jgi:hypothetical protein